MRQLHNEAVSFFTQFVYAPLTDIFDSEYCSSGLLMAQVC